MVYSNSLWKATVQVGHLSDLATDKEIHEFISFSGDIDDIQIRGSGNSRTAFVTFKDPKALEIALLLSVHIIGADGCLKGTSVIYEEIEAVTSKVQWLEFQKTFNNVIPVVGAWRHDRDAKLLNGTHKSHVHSPHEAEILARYKPTINATLLIPDLKQVEEMAAKALEYFKSTRHIVLYYEDIMKNQTKLVDVQQFLRVPVRELQSRQVKIHKGTLSGQVENWGDVQKALKGTPYESFVHADNQM